MTDETTRGCPRCLATVGDGFNLGCPHGGHERAGESPINVKLLDVTLRRVESTTKLLNGRDGTWRVTPADAGAPEGPMWGQFAWRTLVLVDDDLQLIPEGHEAFARCKTSLCFAGWTDEVDALPGERIWFIDADETAALDRDDFQYTMALELASLLLARPDDLDSIRLSTFDPSVKDGDRPVIPASERARRLLGLDRALDAHWRVTRERPLDMIWSADVPDLEPVESLFDGNNTLDDLRDRVAELHRLNDWLMANLTPAGTGDAPAS